MFLLRTAALLTAVQQSLNVDSALHWRYKFRVVAKFSNTRM